MKRIGNRGEVRQLDAALIGKLPSSGSPFEGRRGKRLETKSLKKQHLSIVFSKLKKLNGLRQKF